MITAQNSIRGMATMTELEAELQYENKELEYENEELENELGLLGERCDKLEEQLKGFTTSDGEQLLFWARAAEAYATDLIAFPDNYKDHFLDPDNRSRISRLQSLAANVRDAAKQAREQGMALRKRVQ